ncbi:hypothetical protein KIN20_012353 [Parelaphostrongylus tenuis]|uniref:Uncharacterized protein n=1 Tax=Parelaphostrongylus tenuis TaxID=148309 RepID=A0AAD5MF46_PARTN|nr:hypothetical protein KIN20_012353 [Parelaphostrongylus tenuis]
MNILASTAKHLTDFFAIQLLTTISAVFGGGVMLTDQVFRAQCPISFSETAPREAAARDFVERSAMQIVLGTREIQVFSCKFIRAVGDESKYVIDNTLIS